MLISHILKKFIMCQRYVIEFNDNKQILLLSLASVLKIIRPLTEGFDGRNR